MTKIVPIQSEHIEGFHQALDQVAREKKYLVFDQAPDLDSTREYVMGNILTDNEFYRFLNKQEYVDSTGKNALHFYSLSNRSVYSSSPAVKSKILLPCCPPGDSSDASHLHTKR